MKEQEHQEEHMPKEEQDQQQSPQDAAEPMENIESVEVSEEDPRIAELQKALDDSQRQVEKLREDLVRYAADFENFRKQKEREARVAGERAVENLMREILPVVDDVDRVMQHSAATLSNSDQARPFVEGVELLRKNLMNWLDKKGVKKIEAQGQKMDVNFHEAITQLDHPDAEPDTVIEEYQAGYMLGEKVLRHSKVVVSK
ncbi:nucleotide exchange factor GrpE [Prosthecochloris vibrioformis]|uniref:Protein GrpE n=2 Tax=Prosthecochloris TaxID=1101 RepID=A0A5C4S1D7_PROVB|nr:nucleotide exchange factor GrpE [Prosthecochloris vibrioformis]TNJ37274.1 nucleotide exchange factor GrpE [Prosthecochloris vibrioformis]